MVAPFGGRTRMLTIVAHNVVRSPKTQTITSLLKRILFLIIEWKI